LPCTIEQQKVQHIRSLTGLSIIMLEANTLIYSAVVLQTSNFGV